jgi:hypothetical protein
VRALLRLFTVAGIVVGQGATAPVAAEYSYAVKFVCGTFVDEDALEPVVPGVYMTAISIGNPNDPEVKFSYDVAFTFGSVPFSRIEETIEERDARRLDCDSLFEDLADDGFLKGILYLVAEQRLDIWAFYTARELGAGDQISIDAVQILGRELDGNIAGRLVE